MTTLRIPVWQASVEVPPPLAWDASTLVTGGRPLHPMTQARPDAQLASGGMVADRYRIGDPIGRGGTAAVYEALDLQTGRIVAVKVMAQPPGPQKLTREHYLLMEAQLSMRLTSPHAVRLFEVGVLPDGRPFLVMERLFGRDVGRQLLERGPMSVMDACDIVLQACHALAEAHRLGVVHRDVKPPNLFLTVRADGTPHVKVLDFGLAMMVVSELEGPEMTPTTRNFRVAGTPGYAAPEQIGSRRAIDERADVWALGVVLHELVLGRRPFEGATLIGTLVAAGRDPLPPLGPVPPEFEAIVRRCLEKDRERRFANVADLADALAPLAPPELADYPELVRIAGGRAMPVEESTQRVLPEDDGPTSVIPSRVNSGIDGPLSGPVSSRRRGDATQNDLVRVDPTRSDLHRVEASSSFVAQVVPPPSTPWPAIVAVVAVAAVAMLLVLSRTHEPAATTHRAQAGATPSASSMLLAPLRKQGRGEGPDGWQAEPPASWQEVP